MKNIHFVDKNGTFSIKNPENYSALYFPIASETGLKSSVTPNLGGDSKIDQESFLLEPVSVENLHNNRSTRNFWCKVEQVGCWSVTGASAEEENKKYTEEQDQSELTAGFMWHTIQRTSKKYGLMSEVTSFVPVEENAEIMCVKIKNTDTKSKEITSIAAVPIYGRSADNIRDHRNVTSMLHRIKTETHGVSVKPTMSFDEKGHRRNQKIYFVAGIAGNGTSPVSFYPTVESFIGEGGTYTHPLAVYTEVPGVPAGAEAAGKEAMGGIRFETIVLEPGETAEYLIFAGVSEQETYAESVIARYGTPEKVEQELAAVKEYWQKKVNVMYHTGSQDFDEFMRWVSFQPILRRIYGCSFLPHHDYGRGGRGWRDLWQDCLSLLLMDPGDVRNMIIGNYGGVRIDGTNATIIGHKPGEFVADRNGISRVWMDHGMWPFLTTKLYIDQTGDIEILKEKVSYFKDPQTKRGTDIDGAWDDSYGMQQRTETGELYQGTILEHLLLENLCAFYEVGEHNIIRLRGADWNDALDMADKNGESVAFSCAYAGNLKQLADVLRLFQEKTGCAEAELLEEIAVLLKDDILCYESVEAKLGVLEDYAEACRHNVSGKTTTIAIEELAENLEHKAQWLKEHIRRQEWIRANEDEGWFNSYYDDHKNAVEGIFECKEGTEDAERSVRMMLTGQVFAAMSGTAEKEQVAQICRSADHYLYDAAVGGYRLNTDFKELKFDMGRMFGFAYGEKENGAVFSHMTVMYANALYQRGFVKEGYKALKTLADKALDFETAKIYPGIPEYFNNEGRGMYHYLTGAASWFMMTVITEMFGARGMSGDFTVSPKLMKEQFDENKTAAICLPFAGKEFEVVIRNEMDLEYGAYAVGSADCDGVMMQIQDGVQSVLGREDLEKLGDGLHRITVNLVPIQ